MGNLENKVNGFKGIDFIRTSIGAAVVYFRYGTYFSLGVGGIIGYLVGKTYDYIAK